MAIGFRKLFFRYAKCLGITVCIAFFAQIVLALTFFPPENDNLLKKVSHTHQVRGEVGDFSARKLAPGLSDDEDFSPKIKPQSRLGSALRLEELDFKPACDIESRHAISAIHRAKTQICKQQIVNKTCLIQNGHFYPKELPNTCIAEGLSYGKNLGCYVDEKKMRLLTSFYGNYATTNTPSACLDICVQAGLPYAGVQYGSECFCGDSEPPTTSLTSDEMCDMKCPGDTTQLCGGYFTMTVYETGLAKFVPRTPKEPNVEKKSIRILFLLTLNGRALRQVHRLINALYRSNHYFYIHIDSRQDYLHRELTLLEAQFTNIKLATQRYATIWGGSSLLTMLLSSMEDSFRLGWDWDFVINLSESDFPIKSLDILEKFLHANKGLNFVKSHGREVQRFIKKQGLDKTFIECDTHMWRVGERHLPRGIVIDGGSDWIALSNTFVNYILHTPHDKLLAGLDVVFQHTLLPAESFFHTVLRNTHFCNTYVDNNLHVTNWKRKLGCKCQYKHVVDWCGCSPNDFRTEDWPRIQNTQDRQLFFARKFEPIINQEIINRVEQFIGYNDHHLIPNLEAYWQSLYNADDLTASTDDTLLSHAGSIVRHNAKILLAQNCAIETDEIIEISSYHYADIYKGNLILHKASVEGLEVLIETWYKPKKHLDLNFDNKFVDNVKAFKVSSEYDQKETTFRNLANILGPLSEPVLLYQFAPPIEKSFKNLTVMWLDPAGVIADVDGIQVDENNLTNIIKPNLRAPLLPGIWKVGLFEQSNLIASTKFLITPLEYFSGKELSYSEALIIHSGSQGAYKNYSYIKSLNFLPNREESLLLDKISYSNIKRLHQDLREWIDSLTIEFYSVLSSCIFSKTNLKDKLSCGNHRFQYCTVSEWSSLSPDPKGTIGKLNTTTGRLDRL